MFSKEGDKLTAYTNKKDTVLYNFEEGKYTELQILFVINIIEIFMQNIRNIQIQKTKKKLIN